MAIIKKILSSENLDKISVLVNDTEPNSKYFKITELPDTFTGGKNAFLIQGSEYLVPDTLIKIEIKDAQGNIIYHEPGEGIISASVGTEPIVTEYYEGVSKVVAVYIYPNRTLDETGNYSDGTAYGPCTITILGELSTYDNNGTNVPIPTNWEGKYNVKWQKTVNVNPALVNTTKVRFYKRPTVSIYETLSPIYAFDATGSKVASSVTQSFANVKVSQLDTFAGDVKRIKVYRTSEGDISDYDLIQDILVESKELLTTTALSGSVVGTAGLFTSEVLKKLWNTGSLNAFLTSSRIDNGVRLNGSGKFIYTSSLNLADVSVYELGVDAFYSASTSSDLQIYLSGSNNGEVLVGTLNGISPTKNLKDTIIQFSLPKAEPTASLYLSQSQGEWHVGNLTLQLTQDTAFSPSEVSFVTSMPTVLGNETFNFKFEFYDVNNNYVPVAVTQSALFSGGNNNIGGTLVYISSSASQSLADLTRVSSSISGTIVVTSGSISGSITNVSSSVSGTIVTLSGSVSGSITTLSSSVSQSVAYTLSSSLSNVKNLADGKYSGVFIDGTTVFAPVIGGTTGYISKLLTVGSSAAATINLDARNTTDGAPDNLRRIWIGTQSYGYHNNSNTTVYLDSAGKFSLGNKLNWNGSALSVSGEVVITSGTTLDSINTAQSTANTGVTNAAAAQASANTALNRVVSAAGAITFDPAPSGTGLFLNAQKLGFYDGGTWKTYMTNTGNFYLAGSGDNGLSWNGATLTIDGAITARSGYIGNGASGWAINSTSISSANGQTILNATDGTIKLKDIYGVTKVSLNYDSTNATDPLNATAGTVAVTGIPAGTAYYANGALSGQGPNGYLQTGPPFWAPTWNIDSNFTVPLTANYEFTLKFPVNAALYATKTGGGGNPFIQVRLYIYRNSDSANMNPRGYISIPDEGCNGQPLGTGYYAANQFNTFYLSGISLVAGVSYRFNIQYIIVNADYDTQLTIGYYLPSINASYFAAVASSNMNQTGLNLGQDTDRYIFTKPGSVNLYDGYSSATARQTIGEQAGSMILYNSDLYGYFNDFQRLYINNATYPRSNRSSGGNFITSHFFGGLNRAFLNVRAYVMFEPDSSTGINTFGDPFWAYCLNVDKVTYVTTNTFDITFVEPLYGTEGFPANGNNNFMSAVIANDGASGISLINVTNKTPYGCRIVLSGEDSSGGRVALIVYK
jgi:hypothetical protein